MSRPHPGFIFWLQWTLATLIGRLIGRFTADLLTWVAGHGHAVMPLRMLVLGGTIALCQWWVLRPYLPRAHRWFLATTLGGGVTGMATVLTGLTQWLVLRRWVPRASLWIGITTIAGISSWLLVRAIVGPVGSVVPQPDAIAFLARMAGDLLAGVLTASGMLSLLRQPRLSPGTEDRALPYRKLDFTTIWQPR